MPAPLSTSKKARRNTAALAALQPIILNDQAFLEYLRTNDTEHYNLVKDEPAVILSIRRAEFALTALTMAGITPATPHIQATRERFLQQRMAWSPRLS
jgi:hypothetical protein